MVRLCSQRLIRWQESYRREPAECTSSGVITTSRHRHSMRRPSARIPYPVVQNIQPGDAAYVDLNHDGKIDQNDMTRDLGYTDDPSI